MVAFPRALPSISILSFALLALPGCQDSTDLGKDGCHLLKAAPDGGPTNVLVGDLSAGQDFLSFGSVECEDLICVLDSSAVGVLLDQAATDPPVLNDPALGYCSRACVQGSTNGCTPQIDNLQNVPSKVMGCKQLSLDEDTIAAICQDPVKCQAYFGNNRSPFFCARGDGGV